MAVREFNGTADRVISPLGGGDLTGGWTVATLLKRLSDFTASQEILCTADARNVRQLAFTLGTNWLAYWSDQTSESTSTNPTTVLVADGWCLVAMCKVAGANHVRFHKLPLGGAWTHIDGGVNIVNLASAAGTVSGGKITAGAMPGGGEALFHRRAVDAIWNGVALSDLQIEALATNLRTLDWYNSAAGPPAALRDFNQASVATPVADLIGGSGESSVVGTTVVTTDDPPGWTFGVPRAAVSGSSIGDRLAFFDPDLLAKAWF